MRIILVALGDSFVIAFMVHVPWLPYRVESGRGRKHWCRNNWCCDNHNGSQEPFHRPTSKGVFMNHRTYKLIELVGTSATGTDDAISSAIAKASATIKHMDWFEVTEMRGHIENDRVAHYQVTLKVGFRIEGD